MCVCVACAECREVRVDDGVALAGENGAYARFEFFGCDAQEGCCGAQQHDVGGTGRCGLAGDGIHVECHAVRQGGYLPPERIGIGIVGDVDQRGGVGDDPAPGRKPRQVAECFHRFERDDQVGGTSRNEVGGDFIRRDAQVRLHVAAPLAHAVDFGLLDVQPFVEGGPADDGGDREDALSPYAREYDVAFHGLPVFRVLPPGGRRDGRVAIVSVWLRCAVWRSVCIRGGG